METKKNEAQTNVQEVQEFEVTVTSTRVSKEYPDRIEFLIIGTLPQFNKDGELLQKDSFSLHEYNAEIQLRKLCRRYNKMTAWNDAKPLDPGELGAVIGGATMKIKRTLRHKDEPREEVNGKSSGVYENDTFTTEILSVDITDPYNTDAEVIKLILDKKNTTSFNFGV